VWPLVNPASENLFLKIYIFDNIEKKTNKRQQRNGSNG